MFNFAILQSVDFTWHSYWENQSIDWFFQAKVDKVSLPELIGKWYSKKPINSMLIEDTDESTASTSTIDPINPTNDENKKYQ